MSPAVRITRFVHKAITIGFELLQLRKEDMEVCQCVFEQVCMEGRCLVEREREDEAGETKTIHIFA